MQSANAFGMDCEVAMYLNATKLDDKSQNLSVCVSVATCERSFSKLMLVKIYHRSQMRHTLKTDLFVASK
jgi:hAT family C-terminal dimerisation region